MLSHKQNDSQTVSYSTANLLIRSCIVWLYGVISIFLYSFVVVGSWPFPLKTRLRIVRSFLASYIYVLKKVCLIDYKVEGLEHIPQERGGIILSKHQSTWETFFLPCIFHDPAVIIKRELLWVPFFGWGMAMTDPIAINRSRKNSAMQQIITEGKRCLDEGRWILVFPEGTRVPVGEVGHYKLGGARLAEATGYPVIPVAHNAGYFWPRRKFIKRPGTVHMVIGPLIESKGRKAEEILTLAKNWIEDTVVRIGHP